MSEIDVLSVGFACYDLVYSVDHHPAEDEKMFASAYAGCGGGPAANAAYIAARLGYKVAFAGYLGNDIYGNMHFKELENQGVLTDLVIRGNDQTPLTFLLIKPDGKRSAVNYRIKRRYLKKDMIDFSKYSYKAILFDGHESNIAIPLAKYARENNIPTILDAGSVHNGTNKLIRIVDYVVTSEVFAFNYTGERDDEKALKKLASVNSKVVITLGERGSIWYYRPDYGKFPAYSVKIMDTTGCGDAFHGAFAAGVAAGMQWKDLLAFSSAAGALCCTKMGGRPGMPDKEEVMKLVNRIP
jgi:sulfofructose kinase